MMTWLPEVDESILPLEEPIIDQIVAVVEFWEILPTWFATQGYRKLEPDHYVVVSTEDFRTS